MWYTLRVRARWFVVVSGFAIAGWAVAATLAWRRVHRVGDVGSELARAHDPIEFVPMGATSVMLADVARLRGVRAMRSWFETDRPDPSCHARLLRHVARVAVAVTADAGDVGIAIDGPLRRSDVLSCVRERAGAGGTVRNERYRGVDIAHVGATTDTAIMARRGATAVAWPNPRIVLVGSPEMVRRMLDRALAGRATASERETPTMRMLDRLDAAQAVRFATRVVPDVLTGSGDARERAFQHVVGVGVGASFERGLELEGALACDDFDSPRAVVDALVRIRGAFARDLGTSEPIAEILAIEIDRRAAEASLRWRLTAAQVERVESQVRAWIDAGGGDADGGTARVGMERASDAAADGDASNSTSGRAEPRR